MTLPRRQIVDPAVSGFYHCVSRCVRRAFLCGHDDYTGRSYEHRKDWVESRLIALAKSFAVGIYAYAVMSNHLHVVLHVDPSAAHAWSPEEVARRWVSIFPVRIAGDVDRAATALRARHLASNPLRIAVCRERLASISWFMRCLSEPIARRANREDDCTGRFWEGRFKCQALLDEKAVLACMTYVDLNPIRAGFAETLAQSHHTSIKRRMKSAGKTRRAPIEPIAGLGCAEKLPLSTIDYLTLVTWTGDRAHRLQNTQRERLPQSVSRLIGDQDRWTRRVNGIERDFYRAIGTVEALLAKAQAIGQQWLKGVGVARELG